MRVLRRDHAAAQPAAEFDDPAGLVSEEVLDQERHAAERTGAEAPLIEVLDPIRIGFDDRVDRGIDGVDGGGGHLCQLSRRNLLLGDELGETERIVRRVFG